MTISILVPIYNVADKIERCAVSLFEQTYKDIEYIFVNDCTPDNSIEVLETVVDRYPERKSFVKILNHEKNKGLAGARNTGYDNASGELLMVADSDDYLPSDACEKLLLKMQESGADIVSGCLLSLKPEGKEEIVRQAFSSKKVCLKRQLCMNLGTSSLCGRLFKREVFRGVRAIEGVNLAEDYMMSNRLMLKSQLAWISDVVYIYDETEVRDYSKVYQGHIEQAEKAVNAVYDYYSSTPEGQEYLGCIRMAYLNVLRESSKHGYQTKDIMGKLDMTSKIIAKFFACKYTFAIGNILYKILRKVTIA